MVTFTCQHCNGSLKKKAVDSHRFQCKRNLHLTCIDCLKDFYGDEYKVHLSCVTEAERYGGKDFTLSSAANKSLAWLAAVNSLLTTTDLSQPHRNILEHASANPNLPRAKRKFINFFQNIGQFRNQSKFVESAYDLVQGELKKVEADMEINQNGITGKPSKSQNSSSKEEVNKKKEKKRKTISETQEEAENAEKVNQVNKNKKKKNKESSIEKENTDEQEKVETEGKTKSTETNKKNKKKKKKSVSYEDECNPEGPKEAEAVKHYVIDVTGDEAAGIATLQIEPEENGDHDNLTKLSKKAKKKLLKQKKYEAEIESIEHYQPEEDEKENTCSENGEKKKKSKKNKGAASFDGDEKTESKRETKVSITEPDGKKLRLDGNPNEDLEEQVQVKPKKFKWDQVIKEVLMGADDYEMPLKRLSKKVCGEYMLAFGEKESYEDILLTFNKKVVKANGVRVFKDRARLMCG